MDDPSCLPQPVAIVFDRPLAEAKALVDDPAAFTQEMTKILLEKQSHPLIRANDQASRK